MRYLWILIAATCLVLGVALFLRHRSNAINLSAASHPFAPEFSLRAIDGQTIQLASYRGKVVLLDFWATWCGPCREEIPHFIELQEKYRNAGFQIIGISMDDGPEPVVQFYRELHMNYPVALGGAKMGELYGGVLGLPIAFLIGRDGRISAKHVGAVDISQIGKEISDLLAARQQ